jgi:glycosyltransferase involved in cell wall biosynthesis
LAEYLALGKAIISTPIAQQLPAPLHDREQIHYVDGSEKSVSEAIRLIRDDKEYRRYLENNARKYYEEYLQPESVMSRLILEKNTP